MSLPPVVTAATPAIYATAAVLYTQVNPVLAHASTMPFQATVTPPGRSLGECVDFVFSPDFRKFINASNQVPPETVVGEIGDYLSACVCKVYNVTTPYMKQFFNYSQQLIRTVYDTLSAPPKPPEESYIYSIDEIPPIFQNVSTYFFKVFIPYAEMQMRVPGDLGLGERYTIWYKLKLATTIVNLDVTHYYAHESTPAKNVLSADVFCRKGSFGGDVRADSRVVDLVKELSINYFKKMGVKVYVNDRPI